MDRKKLLNDLIANFQCVNRSILRNKESINGPLPFGQKSVLFAINVEGVSSIKTIANSLQITSGAATQHVEALHSQGLVERETDPTDRRSVNVKLSDSGEKMLNELHQERLKKVHELFSEISDSEISVFNKVLKNVNNKIKGKE